MRSLPNRNRLSHFNYASDILHRHLLVSLTHQIDKSAEVIRLVKHVIAGVATIQNVVNKTAL